MATLVPAVVLGLVGLVVAKVAGRRLIDLTLDPTALLWIVAGIFVVWWLWVAMICRIYVRSRKRTAPRMLRIAGAAGVALLCAAVSAPMAVGAKYAVVQRDLIQTVFDGADSQTTPKATAADPWGRRKRVNVLLLGGDGAVHRPGVRTDSVILASINTRTGSTVMFSLPRNLQRVPFKPGSKLAELYPNGFTDGRQDNAEFFLNAVYRNVPAVHPGVLGHSDNEGADAVKLAVSGALGLRVDYYVLVNLSGFSKLVDAMGGITVNINEPVPIGGNTDAHIAPDDYLQPGPNQKLDGFKALWFTRGRYGSTDYKRMERQRCAINAIADEASPTTMFKRYTKLASASKEIVRTDIPQSLLSAFVGLASKVKGTPMKSVGFERSDEFHPDDPDYDFVHAAVQAALHPPKATPAGTGTAVPAAGTAGTSADASTAPATTEKVPSRASNAKDDCAYHPVAAG
ncbi:LCP family protein [Marmoricola sp. RAF53]|uniref:LCP family protein n=1 Tax=Marmoricola sp. RAF53 TaxID=3233059 RepID=UPI003F9D3F4B